MLCFVYCFYVLNAFSAERVELYIVGVMMVWFYRLPLKKDKIKRIVKIKRKEKKEDLGILNSECLFSDCPNVKVQ